MEFSTNVLLKEEENNRFQLIYASQNYNTFYGVYARFNIDNEILKFIDFKLVNFKGSINLGIKEVVFKGFKDEIEEYPLSNVDEEVLRRISCAVFELKVQALNPKDFLSNFEINLPLEKFKDKYLSIHRNLLEVDASNEALVFDTEFKYRDGIRVPFSYDPTFIDYRNGKTSTSTDKIDSSEEQIDKSPGGICPRGRSKIIS